MESYLQNIPIEAGEVGISKVLMVRKEMIHLKHILTEVFHRKSINIYEYLDVLDITLFEYMEYITQRIRRLHKISREFRVNPNSVVAFEFKDFFPYVELCKPFDTQIVLDFDGVITRSKFKELYKLCIERSSKIPVVCSANPNISENSFEKLQLPVIPYYSNKGKVKKIKKLLNINLKNDFTFFIDDEQMYLEFAWLFGIKTYHYINNKIKYFSLKTR